MTTRSVTLGLLLGLLVSGSTFFNDSVIHQTSLVSNQMPLAVFGAATILLLAINPALGRLRRHWALRPGEIVVIVAIGLAACAWPGFGFYRGFIPTTALPHHWHDAKPAWRAAGVMSYVPGGSPALATAHVRDWHALTQALAEADGDAEGPLRQFVSVMPEGDRQLLASATAEGSFPPTIRRRIVDALNRAMANPLVYDAEAFIGLHLPPEAETLIAARQSRTLTAFEVLKLNRLLLVASLPSIVSPPPEGTGVLLNGEWANTEAVESLILGRENGGVPWRAWWPTLRLWGSLALLLGAACLCLTVIVHPQWFRRELLPYPIARFADELTRRDPDHLLPDVAKQRAFWFAAAAVFVVHGLNGLHAHFPELPQVPLDLNFEGLKALFPDAKRVYGSDHVFRPHLYLTVIAFAFFLGRSVSFTLGVTQFAFMFVGAVLIGYGIPLEKDYIGASNGNNMRFGAYLGMTMVIFYVGRHYYARVMLGAVGFSYRPHIPTAAVWAARGLFAATVLAIVALRTAGLDAVVASLFIILVLLTFLVITRIVAETGFLFAQAWWMPVGVLTAAFGIEALGPTTYIVLAIASLVLVGDPRTALMPYLANGLAMADRAGGAQPSRLAPWLVVMIVLGFAVATFATFTLVYAYGVDQKDSWSVKTAPSLPFERLTLHVAELEAEGTLSVAPMTLLGRLRAAEPVTGALPWMALGIALVITTQAARLRLPWWPIHPVLFLVWGTFPSSLFAVSFLIGWAIKSAVMSTLGARGYRLALPVMVGAIAGELLAGLCWIAVGAATYFITNQPPAPFAVFP